MYHTNRQVISGTENTVTDAFINLLELSYVQSSFMKHGTLETWNYMILSYFI